MRLLDMEDMLLAAERGEVSESRVGPLYAALCALPSCARGFLSGDVVVTVTEEVDTEEVDTEEVDTDEVDAAVHEVVAAEA